MTSDVLTEVAFVATVTEMMFGDDAEPFEVAIVQHTGCGSGFLADPGFRAALGARTGVDDQDMAAAAVTDPVESVRHDVDLLVNSSLVPASTSISGHVYDVDTGRVTTIVPAIAVAQ